MISLSFTHVIRQKCEDNVWQIMGKVKILKATYGKIAFFKTFFLWSALPHFQDILKEQLVLITKIKVYNCEIIYSRGTNYFCHFFK